VQLLAYKAEHGDCNVPYGWAEDPPLGSWVNRQRSSKRKLDRGDPCDGMTVDRAARLTALGVAWDPVKGGDLKSKAANAIAVLRRASDEEWEAQLAKLAAYKAKRVVERVLTAADVAAAGRARAREQFIRGSGGSLEPLGLFLRSAIPCIWRILSACRPS
jgi:hypothetical protein